MDATAEPVHGSTLFAATAALRPPAPALAFDLDVDVCIVGGGLAGLTVARAIALRGWSVVLLEARQIAWNASGRNTGFVLPGFGQSPQPIIDRIGLERARRLWALSEEGLSAVRRNVSDFLPLMPRPAGWLNVSKIDRADEIAGEVERYRALGAQVEFWPTETVRAQLKTIHYYQAIHFPTAFAIQPLDYTRALARAAEEAGVRIFEDTPAIEIDPAGVRKRLVTPGGRVRAGHVVLAGNVHLGGLLLGIASTLLPITTYVASTPPLGAKLAEAIPYRGAVSDTDWADNHYRTTSDTRLIWSGRMTAWQGDPRRYAKALRRDIGRVYPQLGDIEFEHVWNGTLGNAVHRMPQIGEVTPGIWLASGFGGHGLNTTAMAGHLIARAIMDGDKTWMEFSSYELIWAGGIFGRAIAQGSYWAYRAQQSYLEKHSRRRERKLRLAAIEADAARATQAEAGDPA